MLYTKGIYFMKDSLILTDPKQAADIYEDLKIFNKDLAQLNKELGDLVSIKFEKEFGHSKHNHDDHGDELNKQMETMKTRIILMQYAGIGMDMFSNAAFHSEPKLRARIRGEREIMSENLKNFFTYSLILEPYIDHIVSFGHR